MSGSLPSRGSLRFRPRLLPGVGQRNQRDAAESEVAKPSADDEALDPAPGSMASAASTAAAASWQFLAPFGYVIRSPETRNPTFTAAFRVE